MTVYQLNVVATVGQCEVMVMCHVSANDKAISPLTSGYPSSANTPSDVYETSRVGQ